MYIKQIFNTDKWKNIHYHKLEKILIYITIRTNNRTYVQVKLGRTG